MLIKKQISGFDFKEKRTCGIIRTGLNKRANENKDSLIKSASEEIKNYIKTIKSEPGRTKIWCLFLGAGEYYSSNRNGDFFPEKDLIENYKTFKELGHCYFLHQNKDPDKKIGDVEFVTYNKKMHRVEGIMSLINERCTSLNGENIIEKIENGEDIAVSMSAKVEHDICSICKHKSYRFSEYCIHLRDEMNKIYSDGRKVFAINPNPKFFDISVVITPADPTAWMFSKVAKLNKNIPNEEGYKMKEKKYFDFGIEKKSLLEKESLIKKISELEKKINGLLSSTGSSSKDSFGISSPVKIIILKMSNSSDLNSNKLNELKRFPIDEVVSTLNKNKKLLNPMDFFSLIDKRNIFEMKDYLII